MGLDNATLFVANIVILLITAVAYMWVWLRIRTDRHWLYWTIANLVIMGSLIVFVAAPDLPLHLAVLPNIALMLGTGFRLLAAQAFDGRATPVLAVWGPAAGYVVVALVVGSHSFNFALANLVLAAQCIAVAIAFWRGRADQLPSRFGLVGVYGLTAVSFVLRALQGVVADDQISSYLPLDGMLQIHLLVALIHVTGGGVLVLSIAYERYALAMREVALRDSLTGLYNRRAFESRLRALLAGPANRRFAIALLDIDHFKRINDAHGHAVGDAALKAFAAACLVATRPGDQFFRIGGEEFAVIVAEVAPADVHPIVERLRVAVRTGVTSVNGHPVHMTVSAGICHASAAPPDYDSLLAAADAQLYAAKDGGRDRVGEAPPRRPAIRVAG